MPYLVLAFPVAVFRGVRSANSVCGPLEGKGPFPPEADQPRAEPELLWRARPLITVARE